MPEKKLYRSLHNRVIAGICGGIGEYFDIDPVIIRLIWVVTAFMGGAGLIFYILAWVIIPEGKNEGSNYYTARDEEVYRGADAQNKETADTGEPYDNFTGHNSEKNRRNADSTKMVVALAFIIFGVILLFSKFLNWDFFSWKYFFGILFVIIGGGIVYKFFRENKK